MTVERIQIQSRDQWLAARKQDVTASTAAGLLGLHPYVTPYALHQFKSGAIADDTDETQPMRRGRLLEPVAVQMIREDYPDIKLDDYPVGYYYRDPEHRIGATPDLLATDAKGRLGVVQIKNCEPSIFRRDWRGENGGVDPPLWIVVQALIEAYLTGAEWAAVAPMRVSFGVEIELIPIPLHAGIIDRIKYEVAEFWERVERGTPPDPDYGKDGALIAKLFPKDDGSEIDLSADNMAPQLVADLERARADKKDAETREKIAKTGINEKMGPARFARLADGRRISNSTIDRKAYEVAATSFRMIKILNGRAA
jgi:hypothetical protein